MNPKFVKEVGGEITKVLYNINSVKKNENSRSAQIARFYVDISIQMFI